MAKKTLRKIRQPGVWERGYLCHTYWVGTRKLGVIKLGEAVSKGGTYSWLCVQANLGGVTRTLSAARLMVESVLQSGAYQMDLFAPDNASA